MTFYADIRQTVIRDIKDIIQGLIMLSKLTTIGSKSPLKTEPRTMLPESPKAPTIQTIGTKSPLKESPGPVYGSGTPDGERQIVGTQIKLNDIPRLGWQSIDTPMSNRAVDSKKNY